MGNHIHTIPEFSRAVSRGASSAGIRSVHISVNGGINNSAGLSPARA